MRHNVSAQQVQMIQDNDVRKFKNYLKTSNLTSKATRHLFKQGSPEMIKTFLSVSYPIGEEFRLYQKDVIRYADRKTLATYYMYHDLTPSGEIELIKRDEINSFIYYTSGHQLSKKAFKFLLQEGSPELVEAFLSNNNLNSQQLTMLLLNANMDYIQIYMDTATGTEREEILRVVTEMNNTMLLHGIYKRCYDVDLVS